MHDQAFRILKTITTLQGLNSVMTLYTLKIKAKLHMTPFIDPHVS